MWSGTVTNMAPFLCINQLSHLWDMTRRTGNSEEEGLVWFPVWRFLSRFSWLLGRKATAEGQWGKAAHYRAAQAEERRSGGVRCVLRGKPCDPLQMAPTFQTAHAAYLLTKTWGTSLTAKHKRSARTLRSIPFPRLRIAASLHPVARLVGHCMITRYCLLPFTPCLCAACAHLGRGKERHPLQNL